MFIQQRNPEALGCIMCRLSERQANCVHRYGGVSRSANLGLPSSGELLRRQPNQPCVSFSQRSAARSQMPVDRCGNREPGRRVACTDPIEFVDKTLARSVRGHQRMDLGLPLR
jgi:hypothetical protein